jgi:membrane fusion protein (multidrug efflux system)
VADADAIQAATPVPVQVVQPFREDIFATYSATATITSDADAPVVARVTGDVVQLLVEEGDYVEAGQALARLDGERLRLEMLAARANLDQARSELARNKDLHERGLISAASFDNLKFTLEALEATYQLRKLEHDYATIRAPISGYVAAREIKPGQHLSVDDVAFRITDTSELIAYLHIPQAELQKFAPGHTARVEVASMPDAEFLAKITRISPTIDTRNGTFRATAFIDNAGGELAPGMFGRFTVAYEKHADALVVPVQALIDEDDQSAVYVVNNDEVVLRVVETGVETGGMVEILNGLNEQDTVVVVGHSNLRDGSRVLASNTLKEGFTG